MRSSVMRAVVTVVALLVLALGIVALISPIPIGIILIGLSLSALVCVSDTAKRLLKIVRTKYHIVNIKIHSLEAKIEKRFKYLSDAFMQTRPSVDNEKED